ncbi:CobW family GTP-binding protein [Defluviimonas salinarum]|uniref:GTP-binding protein n=1 Tax=Defluviimonas salinarum TaxID=2992147 RepID=A0ABT3J7I0_9RHOB|nr:CobW family GTP-binding protein [Defluviimonas salinarum]MCW3783650.1 GTP-binding protein [Defluviimonas salinarum]
MPLPVTLIAGYLGSGKTTLVNYLLRNAKGCRLAVLVNDFGDLPIDADLIEADDGTVVQIAGGCVCCAYGGNLSRALASVLEMRPRPNHVLIEASGVSLPGSIAATVELTAGLWFNGTLVLADAEQIRRNAASSYLADTITRQLRQGDLLILTKPDLVPDEELAATANWLETIAPRRPVVHAQFGAVPVDVALGSLSAHGAGPADKFNGHSRFKSVVLRPERPVDAEAMASALAANPGVARAKGFVLTPSGYALLHVVGPRYTVESIACSHPIGVVCIGLDAELELDCGFESQIA